MTLPELTPQWQQICSVKDKQLVLELQGLAAAGQAEMKLEGENVLARAVEKPAKLPALKDVPRPEFGLSELEAWTEADGFIPGYFAKKEAGHRYAWSCKWFTIKDDKVAAVNPPTADKMSKHELYAVLLDLANLKPHAVQSHVRAGAVTAQELLSWIGFDADARWPDTSHSALLAYIEHRFQSLPAFLDSSCLVEGGGWNPWKLHPAILRKLIRGFPWRPSWCPSKELRTSLEFAPMAAGRYSDEMRRVQEGIHASWSRWHEETMAQGFFVTSRRADG